MDEPEARAELLRTHSLAADWDPASETLGIVVGLPDLVPCPTCWLPADVVPAPAHEDFPHSHCPRGHDNALIPSVLAHLRTLE